MTDRVVLRVLVPFCCMQIKVQQLLGPDLLRAYLAVKSWEASQHTGNDKLLLRY
jgi:hypothetical protein